MNIKAELTQRLSATIRALNNVTVSGKPNLNNLLGSIDVLESCIELINKNSHDETLYEGTALSSKIDE